jgi:hypothetical protein
MQLWPHGKGLAWEVRRTERAGEVHMSAPAMAAPFLTFTMPAAWFAVFGRLPPARCAAPAALFVVSH